MFCHSVLPTLRKHYLVDHTDPQQLEAYKRKCKALASNLELPEWQWPQITLPFFVLMDWDPRHTWVRQVLATPRVTERHLETFCHEALTTALGKDQTSLPGADGADNVRNAQNRGGISGTLTRNRQLQQSLGDQRATYREQHGYDCELYAAWQQALMQPSVWATVTPQQFMPLCKVAPDVHCPPEHMVGTVKLTVREDLLSGDLTNRALWKGVTYQGMLNEAVNTRGNGDLGKYHISRSVEKQPLVCKILGAEEGEEVELCWVFGKKKMEARKNKQRASKRKVSHTVKGTAGRWIKDSKWT